MSGCDHSGERGGCDDCGHHDNCTILRTVSQQRPPTLLVLPPRLRWNKVEGVVIILVVIDSMWFPVYKNRINVHEY